MCVMCVYVCVCVCTKSEGLRVVLRPMVITCCSVASAACASDDPPPPPPALTCYGQPVSPNVPRRPRPALSYLCSLVPEALGALQQAVTLDPGMPHAWGNLGRALVDAGQLADAAVALAASVDLDPAPSNSALLLLGALATSVCAD